MSVINQMLVDLERRRASGEERQHIPDHVRTLPAEARDTRGIVILVTVVAMLLLAGAVWWWLAGPRYPVMVSALAPAPVPVTPAAPAAEPQETVERIAQHMSLELIQAPESVGAVAAPIPAATVIATREAPVTASAKPPRSDARATTGTVAARTSPPAPVQAAPAAKIAVDDSPRVTINKQVREQTPRQRADAEYAKGTAALHQEQRTDARAAFEAALRIDPAYHVSRQALVGLLLDARQPADAMRVLEEGLQLAPAQYGFAMMLARLQMERSELDVAAQTLARSLDYGSVNADYLAFYAGLLQRQQKHAEAVAQFQRALQLRGNAGVWLLGMGVSLEALGRNAEAQEAYRRARATGNLSAELRAFAEQKLR